MVASNIHPSGLLWPRLKSLPLNSVYLATIKGMR